MNEKVFLIAINYNGFDDTAEFIDSVNKIDYPNYHTIIVDNASTKGNIDVLSEKKNVTVIRSNTNLGFSGGNNLGINYALEHGADYIVLLNNDTLVEPNFLKCSIEYFRSNPRVGLLTGKIMYAKNKDTFWFAGGVLNKWRGRAYHIGSNEIDRGQYDTVKDISFCTGCLMIIPCKVLEKVGIMSEEYFLYYEDTEYSARFSENKYRMVYHPDVKIYHKVSASTGGGSPVYNYYNWRNRLYFISEHIHGLKKISAYSFYIYEGIKRIITRDLPIEIFKRAIHDFHKNVKGKVNL